MKKILMMAVALLTFFSYSHAQELDARAKQKYSADEISQFSQAKIQKLNYLYQHSFLIPEEFAGQINVADIDIRDYNSLRKKSQRVKAAVNLEGNSRLNNGVYIILLSVDELQEAYRIIERRFQCASLPADYPVFIYTGDMEKDEADYARRKKEWIENNQEAYKQMTTSPQLSEEEIQRLRLEKYGQTE